MKPYIVLSIFLLIGGVAFAQESVSKGSVPETFLKAYLDAAKEKAIIYSGKEQQPYPHYYKNHPYLINPEAVTGTLCYDGIVYSDIRMRVDLYRGELAAVQPSSSYHVVLQGDKLDYADLHGSRLIYVSADGLKGNPGEGYYLQLRPGAIPVLCKPIATLQESLHNREREIFFTQFKRYYILKDNVYYAIKSKRSILKVFPTHKKELNQYIKQHKLDFYREIEKDIVAVAAEYERLTHLP